MFSLRCLPTHLFPLCPGVLAPPGHHCPRPCQELLQSRGPWEYGGAAPARPTRDPGWGRLQAEGQRPGPGGRMCSCEGLFPLFAAADETSFSS